MRPRRVPGKALVVTAAALALVAGCSSDGAAASSGVEKPNLNVAVVPALDSAGFFVALYQGLFKAQGLNVHFIPATSSETVIANQVKGTDDITGGNYVSYIQAQRAAKPTWTSSPSADAIVASSQNGEDIKMTGAVVAPQDIPHKQ